MRIAAVLGMGKMREGYIEVFEFTFGMNQNFLIAFSALLKLVYQNQKQRGRNEEQIRYYKCTKQLQY